MEFLTLTNNPAVREKYPHLKPVWVEGGVDEVYRRARDLVHKGHRLLTHPLSSSLKPGRIPYKTVALSARADPTVDLMSLGLMAAAFEAWEKTKPDVPLSFPAQVAADYALVDLAVFESALNSLKNAL
ncbi:MAG: hypothetical protein PWQ41_563 [Bacillota bacterium]|jgi:hypothetical protein|nr:hypothetical protein [Bacillota bacterium]MDK2924789.1 hypothetical protein [Bacillota bacterium]